MVDIAFLQNQVKNKEPKTSFTKAKTRGIIEQMNLVQAEQETKKEMASAKISIIKKTEDSRKTVRRHKKRSHGSFLRSPSRIDFLCLKGNGKKILELLISKKNNDNREEIEVMSNELMSHCNISKDHLSDAVKKLHQKGFVTYKSKYGYRVFKINPSISEY